MELLQIEFTPFEEDRLHFSVKVKNLTQGGEAYVPKARLPFVNFQQKPPKNWRFTLLKALEGDRFNASEFTSEEQRWLVEQKLLSEDGSSFQAAFALLSQVGGALFQAIFPAGSKTQEIYTPALSKARADQTHLHIRLCFAEDVAKYARLADYPWELLHDGQRFLSQDVATFSRYIEYSHPQPALLQTETVNALLVSSGAYDAENRLRKLPKAERDAVIQGIRQAEAKPDTKIRLQVLENPTLDELRKYLTEKRGAASPHLLHFDGHGFFGHRCEQCRRAYLSGITHCQDCQIPLSEIQGYLLFEHDDRPADYVSTREFGELFRLSGLADQPGQSQGVTVAVLSACKSGMSLGSESVFNGIAQNLIGSGVPAVLAMQYSVRVDAAKAFAQQFYHSLCQKDSLARAVSLGRAAMGTEGNQWYRPVLYLRWQDNEGGQLFAPSAPETVNFQPYLRSLIANEKYQRQWGFYIPTHAIGKLQQLQAATLLDIGLMVQLMQPKRSEDAQTSEQQEKTERLPVLEGIRKYVADHVLLMGRPGSGKSTALLRLLLDAAKQALADSSAKIPVLVELRYLHADRPSVLKRIRTFLRSHDLDLKEAVLKTALVEGRFLLLIDGVNELPSDAARRAVARFRQDYPKTPMIFTTRDVALGGDIGIEKKLEMQPLNEAQIRQFVQAYLPQQGEPMLRQLQGRLREVGQTPLLLQMLCEVFQELQQLPSSLGLLFRLFVGGYDNLKQNMPVSEGLRYWQSQLLQHLAFTMMQAEQPTELRVAIPRQEAETVLAEFLQGKVDYPTQRAKEWLEDLLEHHLIQLTSQNQLEFHHQLLQEYYAAEAFQKGGQELTDLVAHVCEPKWQEIVLLVVELRDNSDDLVRSIKAKLDDLLSEHEKLQQLLNWANQKASYIGVPDNPENPNGASSLSYRRFQASVRAFYCANSLTYALNLNRTSERLGACTNEFLVSLNPSFSLDLVFAAALDHENRYNLNYCLVRDRALVGIVDFSQDLNQKLSLNPNYYLGSLFICTLTGLLNDILTNKLIPWNIDSDLEASLWILKRELSDLTSNGLDQWSHKLRCVLINHQVIFGKALDFSEGEVDRIESFFRVNKLLIECLNKARGLTHNLKEEILLNILV